MTSVYERQQYRTSSHSVISFLTSQFSFSTTAMLITIPEISYYMHQTLLRYTISGCLYVVFLSVD